MTDDLDALRARSAALAADLGSPEARRVNAAVLQHDPDDPVARTRLGIGLLKAGQPAEAKAVLEDGLARHPGHPIMGPRLLEADRLLARAAAAPAGAVTASATDDIDPATVVEHALRGPGRDDCVRFCAASIRASEALDHERTAVIPLRQGPNFRIVGGAWSAVVPWKDTLAVTLPRASAEALAAVEAVGAVESSDVGPVASVQMAVPRAAVGEVFDVLLDAHRTHLRACLAAGPPQHGHKHHAGLRRYLVDEAGRLDPGTG